MIGMQKKTRERLERKFSALPLHFIDTDIIFEANNDTKLGNQCSDYLNRVGYNYRGVLPLSVIGEFFLITFRDVQDSTEKDMLFRSIDNIIKKRKIEFSVLKHEGLSHINKIKETDYHVEDTDAIHLANCIQDKGDTFVTFDEKLVDNRELEKEFDIKIMHPKRL